MKEAPEGRSNRGSFGKDTKKDHPEGEKVKGRRKKMKVKTSPCFELE